MTEGKNQSSPHCAVMSTVVILDAEMQSMAEGDQTSAQTLIANS